MKKKQITKILTWSTVALIVPAFGELFVDGWNWGPGEFIFAWVFFNLLGLACVFVTNKISDRRGKVVAGLVVFAIFAFIWVILATG